jgi:hypothetical protein
VFIGLEEDDDALLSVIREMFSLMVLGYGKDSNEKGPFGLKLSLCKH